MSDDVVLDRDLLTRLARHRALGGVPPREHACGWWSTGHFYGSPRARSSPRRESRPTPLWILLSGHIAVHVDRGAGARTVIEWRAGDVAGALPYSRGVVPPGDVVAEEDTDVLAVARERLPDLIHECPAITEKLVHEMVDNPDTRHVTSGDLRDEKLISLGKLAAGLAHELNNPASAALARAPGRSPTASPRRQRRPGASAQWASLMRNSRLSMPCCRRAGDRPAPRRSRPLPAPIARRRSQIGSPATTSTKRALQLSPAPRSRWNRSTRWRQP